mmetsp:Transcript_56450/g.127351  ORF Transcript_56450/g.127351 Transcript_56450/m.127351 type:complete len:225 (-) Transcript_56450:7-681(-)
MSPPFSARSAGASDLWSRTRPSLQTPSRSWKWRASRCCRPNCPWTSSSRSWGCSFGSFRSSFSSSSSWRRRRLPLLHLPPRHRPRPQPRAWQVPLQLQGQVHQQRWHLRQPHLRPSSFSSSSLWLHPPRPRLPLHHRRELPPEQRQALQPLLRQLPLLHLHPPFACFSSYSSSSSWHPRPRLPRAPPPPRPPRPASSGARPAWLWGGPELQALGPYLRRGRCSA